MAQRLEKVSNLPAEVRASSVWQSSAETIAKQTSIGIVVGLAVGVVLFSTWPLRLCVPLLLCPPQPLTTSLVSARCGTELLCDS